MDKQGLLTCSRYAASPNFFGYCGPKKSSNIIDHLKEDSADKELNTILGEFETLYPYLQLIARENKIHDPFNRRVVEAYWIGNNLLKNTKNSSYPSFFNEKFIQKKRMEEVSFRSLKSKILTSRFLPHHSFHVFNIFRRTGKTPSFHTLKTMDECRIGWGKIIEYQILNIKHQNDKSNIKYLIVKTKPLVSKNKKMILGEPIIRKIKPDYKNKQFVKDIKPGEWVSFHWGMICDKLTSDQVKNLEYYTQKAIDFYNF